MKKYIKNEEFDIANMWRKYFHFPRLIVCYIKYQWMNLPTKLCFISEIFWLILSFIKNRRVLSVISLVLFSYKISRAHSLKICSESSNFPISLWMQKLFLWYVLYDGYEKNYLQIEGNHYEQYKGKALLI